MLITPDPAVDAGVRPKGEPLPSPYPGLRPFSERDSRLFFGREEETATLLGLLEKHQLVVVHGASGCGKSSLVRAGIIPVFRMDALANSKEPNVVIVRPADEGGPLTSLARKLDRELPLNANDPLGVEGIDPSWSIVLTASPNWAEDIGRIVASRGATLCIVLDQFEEIFGAVKAGHAAQARRIVEFLTSLAEPSPEGTALGGRALSVIVTMRSDYLGNCAIWDGFAETVNRSQYLLPRISNVGLLRAIHEPAKRVDVEVTQGVAEQLLCVVQSEMDGLPIVQHALQRAFQWTQQEQHGATIDEAALEAVGGAESALSNHADEVFAGATAGDSRLVALADWMLRSLCDLDSDGRIIRRSPSFQQLAREAGGDRETLEALLQPFRDSRNSLIMPPADEPLEPNTTVSVSHEALLREWKRMSKQGLDATGRTAGLAYCELQDGLIWRALAVQGEQFAKDGTSILSPATTEQRLPWYREIAQRPGWAQRHDMRTWGLGSDHVQKHWDEVAAMMKASEENMIAERGKLEKERALVQKLQRSGRRQILLLFVVVLLSAIIAISLWNDRSNKVLEAAQQKAEAVRATGQARKEAAEKRAAEDRFSAIYARQARTAMFSAQRDCAGSGEANDKACIGAKAREYLELIKADDVQTPAAGDTVDFNTLPQSPFVGEASVALVPKQQGGKGN